MTIVLHGEVKALCDAAAARAKNPVEELKMVQAAFDALSAHGQTLARRMNLRMKFLFEADMVGRVTVSEEKKADPAQLPLVPIAPVAPTEQTITPEMARVDFKSLT